jgi:hypothetical protein
MLLYAAVKKYRSKQAKEKESRQSTEQSGQSAFNTRSQPSYKTKTTQATNQVGSLLYSHPLTPRSNEETCWATLTKGINSKISNSVVINGPYAET